MKLKIRLSESVWDDLNEVLRKNKKPAVENDRVMLGLFVLGIGLIVMIFILGIATS